MRTIRRTATGGVWLTAASCGVLLAAAGLGARAATADTLADAITLAYETNPTLQAQRASLRATDEEYVQAEAGLRPSVGASASVTYDNNQLNEAAELGFPGASGPQISESSQGAVQIDQPLYTGGRTAGAIDAAQADILAGRQTLRGAEITVLQNVIDAYLDVRRDQEQLAIAQDNVAVLERQSEETQARFDVGEVTRTDVAQAQARTAESHSQVATAQSNLAIARATYVEVVGENPGDLATEPPIAQLLPPSVDAAFDAAERANPQLLEAKYAEQGSAARLAEAKAATRPSADLTATLGYNGGSSVFGIGGTNNPFADYTRDVTVTASAKIPLFTGGMTSSQIRQAAEQDNVSRIGIESARRQVLQAVAQAWNQLLGARASLVANAEQVKADTIAYEGTRQEQQVGLRTTLDVLNAQQELETSELALVSSRHDEYVAAAAVLAAVGSLEAKDLIPNEPRYDPAKNLNQVKHAVGWVPWDPVLQALDRVGSPSPTPLPPPSPPGEVVKTGEGATP